MSARRTRSVSTKVSEADYARLAVLAGDRTVSEWARTVLFAAAEPQPSSESLIALVHAALAEVKALRTIVLNVAYATNRGERLSDETMQLIIARADADKPYQAQERISASTTRRAL